MSGPISLLLAAALLGGAAGYVIGVEHGQYDKCVLYKG